MKLAVYSTPFLDRPLGSVRKSDVQGWVKSMMTRGLAPGTVHTRVNNLRSVLNAAQEDRLIAVNPAVRLSLPKRRRREAAMTIPTPAQVGVILRETPEKWAAFVGLCAFAGLRLGEAAAVQVGDVDFLGRTLNVSRQVQRAGGGEVELRAPKYQSERTCTSRTRSPCSPATW